VPARTPAAGRWIGRRRREDGEGRRPRLLGGRRGARPGAGTAPVPGTGRQLRDQGGSDGRPPTAHVTARRVCALIAARNEADRIGATVSALRSLPGVEDVVVVDDASTDGTASAALAAGATVIQGRC